MATVIYEGECCVDCLMMMANGELGQGDVEADIAHAEKMHARLDHFLEREDWNACPSGGEDDEARFSSRPCDACGSPLAGDREKFAVLVD